MKLGELIAGLPVHVRAAPGAWRDLRVCDLTEDSRTVMPGSLFVARRGEKSDGRAFIAHALSAGAVAVLTDESEPDAPLAPGVALVTAPDIPLVMALLAERFYGAPSSRLSILGVTGTNGKTTIVHLVHQILNASRTRCGLIGTVQIDDGVEIAKATLTTPSAMELSHHFARMVDAGAAACAMEVSSHSLHQKRVGAIAFAAAVFTNLTGDHLDYHGGMESYAAAKAMLFDSLAPGAVAIVNDDDPWAPRITRDCRARAWSCSLNDAPSASPAREHHLRAQVLATSPTHTDLLLTGPWGELRARVPLVGRHNAMNVLQAAAAAHALGLPRERIAAALARVAPPPGRLERVTLPDVDLPLSVVVDYAHSDDSLAKALEALRPLVPAGASLWTVFGCGGDRDRTKRPRMGAVAARLADRVVVTSDNPRTERPEAIIEEILVGVPAAQRAYAHVDPDRAAAIAWTVEQASPGDIVLIAGKGHEDYQILPDGRGGTHRRHFDDREEARAALTVRFTHVPESDPVVKPAPKRTGAGRGGPA